MENNNTNNTRVYHVLHHCFYNSDIIIIHKNMYMRNNYNYTYNFQNVDSVLYDNYKYIINDKKKRSVYLRLRENMVNRNIYM